MDNPCTNCPYNAKLLHPKMPFGCFLHWCDGEPSTFDKTNPKTVHDEWINQIRILLTDSSIKCTLKHIFVEMAGFSAQT